MLSSTSWSLNVNYITQQTLRVVFEQRTECRITSCWQETVIRDSDVGLLCGFGMKTDYMTKHFTKVQQQNTTHYCKNIWYSAFIVLYCMRSATIFFRKIAVSWFPSHIFDPYMAKTDSSCITMYKKSPHSCLYPKWLQRYGIKCIS